MAPIVGAYYPNWSVYDDKHYPQDLPSVLTHVFYAFMKPNPKSGCVESSDDWADSQMPIGNQKGAIASLMQHRSKYPWLKVIVSIGGWGTHDEFKAMAKKLSSRKNFINSVIEVVQKYNFDGVDLDWEYPSNPKEAAQLLDILTLLRKTLSYVNPELTLSIAAPAGVEHVDMLDIPAIDRLVLFWNIMCYDYTGSEWSSRVGYHSNLYGFNGDNSLNTDSVLKMYIQRGASQSKLVLGMPAFGRRFVQPNLPQVGSDFKKINDGQKHMVQFNRIKRWNEVFDRERVAAMTYDASENVIITYDNEECAAYKARYVKENGLAGGFWWDSAGDAPKYTLIDSFVANLQ